MNPQTRSRVLVSLAIMALAPTTSWAEVEKRPNVLLLLADDQRADTIHALGNAAIRTPNLDTLARSGMVFRNAYCMGGDVAAVCLPSRRMLLSGRSLFRLNEMKPESPTLPQMLSWAGYATYHHGKRGNTPHDLQKAFDVNRYLADDEAERTSGQPGREIADAASAYLKERPRDKPFFMYLAFGNPHDPRVASPATRATYQDDAIPLPANFLPVHPFNNGELTIRDEALVPWPRTPEIIRKELADYYAVITDLDAQIGRILDALRESGQYEDTLIIFTADQGLAMGSHGLMGKQNLYEDSMKVPLIVAGPGVSRGGSWACVYLMDLFPTICEFVRAVVPSGLEGGSFAQILWGSPAGRRSSTSSILLGYRDVQRSVRKGDWKLIRYPKIHKTQLFDLKNDPDEIHDLADDPAQARRIADLMGELQRLQKRYGDSLPLTAEARESAEVDPAIFRAKGR